MAWRSPIFALNMDLAVLFGMVWSSQTTRLVVSSVAIVAVLVFWKSCKGYVISKTPSDTMDIRIAMRENRDQWRCFAQARNFQVLAMALPAVGIDSFGA